MTKIVRWFLRFVMGALALVAVALIMSAAFWYAWRAANERKPETAFEITASRMEQWAIGLYLRQLYGDQMDLPADADDTRERTFVIEAGESVPDIALRLERQGLVSNADLFRRTVQYWGADGDIQAGVFLLSPSMPMEEIVKSLQHGRLPTVKVTIPEGWRVEEIATLLEDSGVCTAEAFLQVARNGLPGHPYAEDRPEGSPASLEGFLFPDTYQLPLGTEPERVAEIMLSTWDARVPNDIMQRAAASGRTVYEVVTLASIVEREAVMSDEQPLIAGVYARRLATGMYLQSDPTVQYAKGYDATTGRWWNPMLQEEALTVISPYNSFLNPGLPPGPICNPGLAAIQAALEPEDTDYLFFYARGDGSHVFAETYEEHLANEALYGGQ